MECCRHTYYARCFPLLAQLAWGVHSGRRSRASGSVGPGGNQSCPSGSGLGFRFAEGSCWAGFVWSAGSSSASSASLMATPTTTTPTTMTAPTTLSGAAKTQRPIPRAAAPAEATAHRPVRSLNRTRSWSRAAKHRSANTGQDWDASRTAHCPPSVHGSVAARWRLAILGFRDALSLGLGADVAQAERKSRSAAQARSRIASSFPSSQRAAGQGWPHVEYVSSRE